MKLTWISLICAAGSTSAARASSDVRGESEIDPTRSAEPHQTCRTCTRAHSRGATDQLRDQRRQRLDMNCINLNLSCSW